MISNPANPAKQDQLTLQALVAETNYWLSIDRTAIGRSTGRPDRKLPLHEVLFIHFADLVVTEKWDLIQEVENVNL